MLQNLYRRGKKKKKGKSNNKPAVCKSLLWRRTTQGIVSSSNSDGLSLALLLRQTRLVSAWNECQIHPVDRHYPTKKTSQMDWMLLYSTLSFRTTSTHCSLFSPAKVLFCGEVILFHFWTVSLISLWLTGRCFKKAQLSKTQSIPNANLFSFADKAVQSD